VADENLSLSIVFEDAQQLIAEVEKVKDAIRSLSELATGTGLQDLSAGFDDVAVSMQQLTEPVNIDINADVLGEVTSEATSAKSEIGKVGDTAKSSGDKTDAAAKKSAREIAKLRKEWHKLQDESKKSSSTLVKSALQIAGIGSIALVVKKLAREVQHAAEVFIGTERAVLRFASGLKAVGNFSEAAIKEIQQYADAIQAATGISDDFVIHASALIAQLGGLSGKGLRRATDAAIELATVLQTDLKTAALLVAKAAQGNTTQFQRYGIVVDNAIPKSKKFAAILTLLETKFKGTAALSAQGLGGSITKFTKEWDDLLKAIGGTFRIFEPIIHSWTAALDKFNDALDNHIDDAVLASDHLAHIKTQLLDIKDLSRGDGSFADQFKFDAEDLRKLLELATGKDPGVVFAVPNDQAIKNLKEIEAGIPALQVKADLVFSGDEKGVLAFINQIDEALRALPKARKDLQGGLFGSPNEEGLKRLDLAEKKLRNLLFIAQNKVVVTVEEKDKRQIARIQALVNALHPPDPLQVFVDTKLLDDELGKAEKRLDELARQKTIVELSAKLVVPFAEFNELFDEIPIPTVVIESAIKPIELKPEFAKVLDKLDLAVEASVELTGEPFILATEDMVREVNLLLEEIKVDDTQAVQRLARIAAAYKRLQTIVGTRIESNAAQKFFDELNDVDDEPTRRLAAELANVKDRVRDLAALRGADPAELLRIDEWLKSVKTIGTANRAAADEIKAIQEEIAKRGGVTPERAGDISTGLSDFARQVISDDEAMTKSFGALSDEHEAGSTASIAAITSMLPPLVRLSLETDEANKRAQAFFNTLAGGDFSSADEFEQAADEVRVLADALEELQSLRGATGREIIDLSNLTSSVTTAEQLLPALTAELDKLEERASDPIQFDQTLSVDIANLVTSSRAAIGELVAQWDTLSPAMRAAIADYEQRLDEIEKITAGIDPNVRRVAEETAAIWESMGAGLQNSFGDALATMLLDAENFADRMRAIIKSLVADLIKTLLKLAALNIFKSLIPGGSAIPLPGPSGGSNAPIGPNPPTKPLPLLPPQKLIVEPFTIPDRLTPVLDFSRLSRAQAAQTTRRQEPVIVRIEDLQRPVARDTHISISADIADGASLRRQITGGALRAELARAARRGRL